MNQLYMSRLGNIVINDNFDVFLVVQDTLNKVKLGVYYRNRKKSSVQESQVKWRWAGIHSPVAHVERKSMFDYVHLLSMLKVMYKAEKYCACSAKKRQNKTDLEQCVSAPGMEHFWQPSAAWLQQSTWKSNMLKQVE